MKHLIFSIFILLMPFAVAAQIACYSFDKGIVRDQVSQEVGYATRCEIVRDRFGRDSGAIHVSCANMGAITVGQGAQLKPTTGTVMLWVKIPAECRIGQAWGDPILFLLTPTGFMNNYNTAYGFDYLFPPSIGGDAKFTASAFRGYPSGLRYVDLNTWYHLALSFTDTEAKFYINGTLERTATKEPTQYSPTEYAYIGYRPDSQNFGDVTVDEFRVYNTVLTQQQIAAIYTAPSAATCTIVGTENATNSNDMVRVFPNPTTGNLQLIHQNGISLKSYTIADISGRFIAQNASIPSDNMLHLDLPNGVYFLFVSDAEGLVSKHKVVVLH